MATPDAQSLAISSAPLLDIPSKVLAAMEVYLLWLAQNPGGTMTQADISTLAANASCVAACMSDKLLKAATVYLLSIGGSGGGGGGSGTTQVYFTASPPAAPANPAGAALWYPPGGGGLKEWNGSAWI